MMRVIAVLACLAAAVAVAPAGEHCPARVSSVHGVEIAWEQAPTSETDELDAWCRAVGPPIVVEPRDADAAPISEVAIVSWNAQLDKGRLADLVADLRGGRLTGGTPVEHFVLLVQELVRGGAVVPVFADGMRSALPLTVAGGPAADPSALAAALDLAFVYVPAMRNGAGRREDRGNAVFSTAPLTQIAAFELPLERQRRVVVGATVPLRDAGAMRSLRVFSAHLEPVSARGSLWLFRNPRRAQVAALIDYVYGADTDAAGIVIGGDFNTVQGGDKDPAYRDMRAWSRSLRDEDRRATHAMGRLDYVFARLSPGWAITTTRLDDRYGSDHYPVLARIRRSD